MKKKWVMLDPGHGGWDAGIRTETVLEKDVNLAVCLAIREFLQLAGVDVRMTREDDREVTASKRAEMANAAEVDLFVSWHCDALPDSTVTGVSLWVAEQSPDLHRRMADFEIIGEEICEMSGQILLGVFQDHEKVLQEVTRPAVVIKGGFLSHLGERERCADASFVQRQAAGAAQGILRVLTER